GRGAFHGAKSSFLKIRDSRAPRALNARCFRITQGIRSRELARHACGLRWQAVSATPLWRAPRAGGGVRAGKERRFHAALSPTRRPTKRCRAYSLPPHSKIVSERATATPALPKTQPLHG